MSEAAGDHPSQLIKESVLSGEETVNLISRLLNAKLDKKCTELQRGLDQKDLATSPQIKQTEN